MGKSLSLGPKLKYPITINKLLKRPGDEIKRQEPILQFKFTWMKEVGDPFGEQWQEEQTTIADWESPADGNIKSWKIQEGMVVTKDMPFVEIEEACPHSIQFRGLCGMCGKDMTEMSWVSSSDDTERAKISMIHDQTALTVSQDEASRAEEELQRRLLKHRKLSLVVDLDQTIIHACIDPTVGEWQNDKSSPNYEAVKDVKSFQLNDDGPRGVASHTYYIKMRPGLKEFLTKVAEMYELHVYTMGTRAYALNIAKLVDPDKKLFGDRIISRDENGNLTSKSLARLFPVDTKMVVIIDDRADVWPKNRPNLIKVVPYDFFLGIGDINSSFLPKREELPKLVPALKKKVAKIETNDDESPEEVSKDEDVTSEANGKEDTVEPTKETRVNALEELVRMGGGDDQALRLEQAAEQEAFLEKQLTERPLLHLQEKLDQEEEEEEGTASQETTNGEAPAEHPHHRHNLLKDDDVELMYLENHLTQLHKDFYDEYESALVTAHGGRVAQLKPGHNKKLSLNKDEAADLKIVPDIGLVMPRLKEKVLAGCTIVMSGLVPLHTDIMRTEIGLQAASFGAEVTAKIGRRVTHLVASTSRTRTQKVKQAAKYPNIKIVNQQWLLNSMSKWEKEDETPYLVQIYEQDKIREEGFNSSAPSSINDSDESSDDDASDDEDDAAPASQEEATDDVEGVMPEDIEEGHSPIDDLKGFDWGEVDDELADFMGSDSENDSDASSASDSSKTSQKSARGVKRPHDQANTEESDSEEDSSKLSKRVKKANARSSTLKTVKTPNSMQSESSLPTPGVTGDEDGDDEAVDQVAPVDEDEDEDDASFDDDLEADLMAEFDREDGGG